MLGAAFRDGLAAVRAAGWRAYAVALLSYVPVFAAELVANVVVFVIAFVLQVVVLLGLVRLLGAWRPEPVPAPPQVDDEGRRVRLADRRGPAVSLDDRRVFVALRNAVALARPAFSLTGLFLLAYFGAILTVIALSGGKVVDYSSKVATLSSLPVSALFVTFLAVAPQRIALEGETRVILAAAHSVRVARMAYGPLLLVTILEPLVTSAGALLVPEKDPPLGLAVGVGVATVLVASVFQVVTTAMATEIYLRGPRVELPVAGP